MKDLINGFLFGSVIFFVMLFVVTLAKASEVPKYLEGGTVKVVLSDGTEYTFKSEEYAVVPRLPIDEEGRVIERIYKSDAYKVKPNSVKLYGGVGPDGLSVVPNANGVVVEQDYGFNYAVGAGRRLSNTISLDGLLLMNRHGAQGGLFGIGYNF